MRLGHRGIRAIFALEVPIVVALQGWAIGASFQRGLLCDRRVAAGGARFMLPEVGDGAISDTGGVRWLFQICGHGLEDMVQTGRVLTAEEALGHGIVSQLVPPDRLDEEVPEIAEIAGAPPIALRAARRILGQLAMPEVIVAMDEEMIAQTFIAQSDDIAKFRGARAEGRALHFRGN
jgi:enoyl-CoA hydratase